MKKQIYLIFIGMIAVCVLTSKVFSQQRNIDTQGQSINIDLNEAQKVAEEYINLLKEKRYEEAFDMVQHPVDHDESDKETNLKAIKLFYEEFGNIIDCEYKSNQWHKPLFSKHWPPDKVPFVDKPEERKEPPYLSLIYQIQYETLKMDKEIQLFKDEGGLKIQKAKDKASSLKAIQKMMNWSKRLPTKSNKVEDNKQKILEMPEKMENDKTIK
ncbi:MAG: hypothetical protein K8S27_04450 [Candidatus Omnitrophica bacterium]|nr:hypothetical protein [Candidatus Omnitrophota bacterium]